jgi:hypothetical protein
VVPGRDDHEQHERGVDGAGDPHGGAARQPGERRADDDRIADVHARDRRVRVVERADEPLVQVDVAARDRVEDADVREPRRRRREDEESDERDPARQEQCRPHERERGRPPPVQPEQHRARDGEVETQIRDAQDVDQAGKRPRGALHAPLDEEMERLLDGDDILRVALGGVAVARDETARRLVRAVEEEHRERLRPERVPGGEPLANSRTASLRPRGGSRHRGHC